MATRVRRDKREHGAVLVTVSLSLVALIAAAALAIDLGSTLVERRAVRNAADHAALAAAWADCNGNEPIPAGEASASRNGYDTGVVIQSNPDGVGWHARVDTTVDMRFAGVVGLGSMDVSGEAVADCAGAGGGPRALFASGDCGTDPTMNFNGSTSTVWGGIHSNGNTVASGSDNDFGLGNNSPDFIDDPFTYVTYHDESGSGNLYDPPDYPDRVGVVDPPPIVLNITDFNPSSEFAADNFDNYYDFTGTKITGTEIEANGNGIYYTTETIDLSTDLSPLEVTLISEMDVIVNATAGQEIHPFPYNTPDASFPTGVLVFSSWEPDSACSDKVVTMNGSGGTWTGLIYGTGGKINISGSSNLTISGSILGHNIELSGSDLFIQSDPDLFPPADAAQLLK